MSAFVFVFVAMFGSSFAAVPDGSSSGSNSNAFAFSGSGSGTGTGYGSGNIPIPYQNFQSYPQFDLNNFFNAYFDALRKYQQASLASAYTYVSLSQPNSRTYATAHSSFSYSGLNQIQSNAFPSDGFGYAGGFPSYNGPQSTGSAGTGGVGAGASASIGGGQVHQTAQLSPENPAVPNIDARFGAPDTNANGGGGTYGVFTSSQSGSSNIDGKPSSYRVATTSVNNNGKVSTYTVHDP